MSRPSRVTRHGCARLSEITGTSPVMTGLIRLKSARLSAVAMQVGAVGVEPGLGAADIRIDARNDPPEPARMIHLDQMRDLVRGEIVEHEGRSHDQPPRERQNAARGTRAPSAALIAHRYAPEHDTERLRRPTARGLKIMFWLTLEKIVHPPRDVRCITGNAQQMFAVTCLGPDGAPRAGPMLDPVQVPAQRQHRAVDEGLGPR